MRFVNATLMRTMLGLALAALSPCGFAQYALAVSPPRFELVGKPGLPIRNVIELSQVDVRPGTYTVRTADWTLNADGSVDFTEALAPTSCRPWVAIERREVVVQPGRPYRYRFEVTPPVEAAPNECRFALLIEGREQTAGTGVPMGLSARVGVIVYLAVGDVQPVLTVVGNEVKALNGRSTPMLRVRNDGTAHGRLNGFLTGSDATGSALEFSVANSPILPGETRDIPLSANRPGNVEAPIEPRFPISVRGKLEWGTTGSIAIDQRFVP